MENDKKLLARIGNKSVYDEDEIRTKFNNGKTVNKSGISREFFFKYYSGRNRAVAYKLTNLNIFEDPKKLEDYGVSTPPQSYVYVH